MLVSILTPYDLNPHSIVRVERWKTPWRMAWQCREDYYEYITYNTRIISVLYRYHILLLMLFVIIIISFRGSDVIGILPEVFFYAHRTLNILQSDVARGV
jgi:hypothetical protein